jgi:hypothetical protein
VNCDASGAGTDGFGKNGTSDSANFFNCSSNNNSGVGFQMAITDERYEYCDAYSNGSHGFYSSSGGAYFQSLMNNCVTYGNTGSGLCINQVDGTIPVLSSIGNCSFVNNVYGIRFENAGVTTMGDVAELISAINYNHHYNNSSGATNISGAAWTDFGIGQITGDPLFTDPGNGDFSLSSGSPLLNTGLAASNIGKVQSVAGGGGGLLTHPGMSGGMRG